MKNEQNRNGDINSTEYVYYTDGKEQEEESKVVKKTRIDDIILAE